MTTEISVSCQKWCASLTLENQEIWLMN